MNHSILVGALLATTLLLSPFGAAIAQRLTLGDLTIDNPVITASRPGQVNGALRFDHIRNAGTVPDRLVSAASPVARVVEIHTMTTIDGVMRMRPLPGIDLPPGEVVGFTRDSPGGYHVMLLQLVEPLQAGRSIPVSLQFEKAGRLEFNVDVTPVDAASGDGHGMGHGHERMHGHGNHGKMN